MATLVDVDEAAEAAKGCSAKSQKLRKPAVRQARRLRSTKDFLKMRDIPLRGRGVPVMTGRARMASLELERWPLQLVSSTGQADQADAVSHAQLDQDVSSATKTCQQKHTDGPRR